MDSHTRFSGKAGHYAKARPGYPADAVAYLSGLAGAGAIADIGAGTGKLTAPLAGLGNKVYAVEPNADMRELLTVAMAGFANAEVLSGSAEETGLAGGSVGLIVAAQALHWFDLDGFRKECRRIGSLGALVAAVYNINPDGDSVRRFEESTKAFFTRPTVREFRNEALYTRELWMEYMSSHSHSPLPSDPGYRAHEAESLRIFEERGDGGLLRVSLTTKVVSEPA